MFNIRKKHIRDLSIILFCFIIVVVIFGILSLTREYQYYSRIFFILEINIILTVSLALINGFTGQFSLGHAGFMAIGAYSSVIITTILPKFFFGISLSTSSVWGHIVFLMSLLFAGLISGTFGFLIGFPSLRLKGDYLAIVTLASGEIIRAGFRFFDFLGGPRGISGIPAFSNAFYIGLFLFLTILMIRNFLYSHYGRACIAVRDNEIAASTMGINTTFQKVWAFILGAFFAGIAGGLFAHLSRYINPDNFGILKTLDILIFLYIGGPHTIAGSIVGAGIFTLIPELLRFINLESWRLVIYPVILILVMRFMRDGIMGEKEFGFLVPLKHKELKLKRNL